MGQRTQIILNIVKKDRTSITKTFHYQWGFGRVMFFELMKAVLDVYTETRYAVFGDQLFKGIEASTTLESLVENKENAIEYYKEKDTPEQVKKINELYDRLIEIFSSYDPNDFSQTVEIIKHEDNNNGAMVIQITEPKEPYGSAEFTIGMLLGSEDSDSWETNGYISIEEYCQENGGSNFSDKQFAKLVRDFMTYFEIEEF